MKINLSQFLQIKLNVLTFKFLPPAVSLLYMRLLGTVYFLFKRREKHLIERNIRDMLGDRCRKELNRLTRDTFNGIFKHYFEKIFAAFKPLDYVKRYVEQNFNIEGIEVVDKALSRGRGALLVTAHWGAVEFIPWVLAIKGYPISVILECTTKTLMDALSEKIKHRDIELISSEKERNIFLNALQSLKKNRLLMTECDEVDKWHKREKHTIKLFGKDLYFDNTLDIIAKRARTPVIAAFLERTGKHSYTLHFEDVSVEKESKNIARDTLSLWEKYVIKKPDQWYQWKKWADMKVAS